MDETPTLGVEGVRKEYGSVTALDGVDLSVEGPEIVGVAGPNGSGKTTLIHCLLGLERPTAGETRVGGRSSRSFAAADRERIGYMPQETAVYDDLTVRENVAFFARLYGVGVGRLSGALGRSRAGDGAAREDRARAVADALETVELADRADARVDGLSGGMVRRTSLACALVHDPDVLFLDEPTVGLDPQLRASMWREFRERRDDGAIVVVSTHYLGEVTNCDRVVFLRGGRVLAFDAPEAFLESTGTDDMEDAFLALLEDADRDPDRVAPSSGGER
ncbi:MAG: ABC transporter ATP-binding protein [Halosimplex sp.]